jgi:tripartite-type tricarboxylate transporter receptor subunit TctC
MKIVRSLAAAGILYGVAALSPLVGVALAAFPEKEITIIVPYGAGGSTDVCVRAVASGMEKILGVPVQVVNRPGGQGTNGPQQLLTAAADGYTIATAGTGSIAIAPHMLGVNYNPDSFTYLPGFAQYLYGIATQPDSSIKTVADLMEAAKARKVTFGSTGAPSNVVMFELNKRLGTNFRHVPFPSGAEAVTAAIGGHVDVVIQDPPVVLPAVQSGRLRLIASASEGRWKTMPDVPTMKEQGVDVVIDSLIGFIAPKGVSDDRVEVLTRAITEAAHSTEVQALLDRLNMVYVEMAPDVVHQKLKSEYDRFGVIVREFGLDKR